MFNILLSNKAEKFLKKIDSVKREKIKLKLKLLVDFPDRNLDIIKIIGEDDTYRVRIGKIRVLFVISQKGEELIIVDIDFRGNIYKSV